MYAIAIVPLIMLLAGEDNPRLPLQYAHAPGIPTTRGSPSLPPTVLHIPLPGAHDEDTADSDAFTHSVQAWFADDAAIVARARRLRHLWDLITDLGPPLGYHPNALKSWVVVKPQAVHAMRDAFDGTGIQITAEGARHLGAVLGTLAFKAQYVESKVERWTQQIRLLADIARYFPRRLTRLTTMDCRAAGIISYALFPTSNTTSSPLTKSSPTNSFRS